MRREVANRSLTSVTATHQHRRIGLHLAGIVGYEEEDAEVLVGGEQWVHRQRSGEQGRNHVFKVGVGVQFLGLVYYTEQNTDGVPSFVHYSVLRNGNHTLHQKSWGGPSNFFGGRGGSGPPSRPTSGCALAGEGAVSPEK